MEPTIVAILAGTAANAVVVLGGLALWFGYRAHRAKRPERLERLTDSLEARLAELTRAIDVIAVEVERIAEAQRYLTMQGRSGAALPTDTPTPPTGRRIVTPH